MDHSLAPVVAMIFCITIDAERQAKILTLPIIVHTVLEIFQDILDLSILLMRTIYIIMDPCIGFMFIIWRLLRKPMD